MFPLSSKRNTPGIVQRSRDESQLGPRKGPNREKGSHGGSRAARRRSHSRSHRHSARKCRCFRWNRSPIQEDSMSRERSREAGRNHRHRMDRRHHHSNEGTRSRRHSPAYENNRRRAGEHPGPDREAGIAFTAGALETKVLILTEGITSVYQKEEIACLY